MGLGFFFLTGKCFREGDPLSPLLFNLVIDVLTRMLSKASQRNIISGLCTNLFPGGVICLQYANDTILFIDKNQDKAKNLKTVLTCFEKVSGMKINYSKSELIPMGMSQEALVEYLEIFGCVEGKFPIKHLGIPLHYDKLMREDIQPLIDKILKSIVIRLQCIYTPI